MKAALAASAVLISTGTALSQDGGGLRLTLGVSSGVRAHNNFYLDPVSAGPTVRSDTRLTFGLESENRRHKLALSFGAAMRVEEDPRTGFFVGPADPNASLSYALEGADARLSFEGSFNQRRVNDFTPLNGDEELRQIDLIADAGTRRSFRLGATLETGVQSPLGFLFELERRGDLFSGTTRSELSDRTTDRAAVTALLRFSPVSEGWVMASAERYSAEDAVMRQRDTFDLQAGVLHNMSETTAIEASIGLREIDDSLIGSFIGVQRGPEVALSVTHELPRGSVELFLGTDLISVGRRNTVEARRQFTFPAGTLTVSLGGVNIAGIAEPIGSLSYSRELPWGEITALLSHNITVNIDGEIQRTTQGAIALGYEVSKLSSLDFDLAYVNIDAAGIRGFADTTRSTFRATYRRALTEDWILSAGYEGRGYLDSATTGPAWDNGVFVTIDRVFSRAP